MVKKQGVPNVYRRYGVVSVLLLVVGVLLSGCGAAKSDPTAPSRLSLRLADLPSNGYTISKQLEMNNTSVAQQYSDPKAVLKQFQKWGRKTGYYVEYTRKNVTEETSKAGPLRVQSNISEYATADGAYQGLLFVFQLAYEQATSLSAQGGAGQFIHTRVIGQRSFFYTYSEIMGRRILVHYLLVFQHSNVLATVQTVTVQGGQTSGDVITLASHIDKRIPPL